MATLPPPKVKPAPADSLEKKVYNLVDKFQNNIPLPNDRYRLGYTLFKYLKGEGDTPEILLRSTKIEIQGIARGELAAKINEELANLK